METLNRSFSNQIIHNDDVETLPLSRTDRECFIDTNVVTAICEWSTHNIADAAVCSIESRTYHKHDNNSRCNWLF